MWPFDAIANAYERSKQRKRATAEIAQLISSAVRDGALSQEKEREIVTRCTALGITDHDISPMRLPAYARAVAAVTADGSVTDDQIRDLEHIQRFLKLTDADVAIHKQMLHRAALISQIHRGQLATVDVSGLVRKKGETLHWRETASLLEERVVDRRYVGASHGVSLRIAKGVTYRIGAQRGHLVTEKAIVPVSTGDFVISNMRVIFLGYKKSFNVYLTKIMDIHMFADGVQLTEESGKQRVVRFVDQSNADVVGATLQYVINASRE
jgi:hypothetical protein